MNWSDVKRIFVKDDTLERAIPKVKNAEHLNRGFSNFSILDGHTLVGDERGVLAIAAAYRCIAVRSETIAMLSGDIISEINGVRKNQNDLIQYELIFKRPCPSMNAFVFIRTLLYNKLMRGQSFAIIHKDAMGVPERLEIRKHLEVIYDDDMVERYFYDRDKDKVYSETDVIYLSDIGPDGQNRSVLSMHQATFGKIKSQQQLSNELYSNKMFLGALVTYPENVKFSGQGNPLKTLSEQMSADYGGIDKAGKVLALDQGASLHQFENVMSMADAEYIMDMNFSVEDICRIFAVPPYKIFHFNKMTYDNMEQMGVEFVQSAVLPDVKQLEQEYAYKLFTPLQRRRNTCIKYELKSLMQGDIKAQAQYYKDMVGIGKYTINELRDLDNQNPVDGGDQPFIQANNYFPLNKMQELADATIAGKKNKISAKASNNDKQGKLFDDDGNPQTDKDVNVTSAAK